MQIKIYQINAAEDNDRVKFLDYDSMLKSKNGNAVDPCIYDEVFSGCVDEDSLEDIYIRFNTNPHPLHRGHLLSVSDVVVADGCAYFCNNIGFKKIDFDESLTHKPDNLMRIVYVEPHKKPFVAEIENSLKAEQKAVGGLIEAVCFDDSDAIIVCNDEGKLIGMDGNRRINNGKSIIAGSFFVVGVDGDNFRSLTDEETERYMAKFDEVEDISQDETQGDMGFEIYTF